MTKAELIEENNRLKEELRNIQAFTSLDPLSEKEKEFYEKGEFSSIYAYHLGAIALHVEFALDPDWMFHK